MKKDISNRKKIIFLYIGIILFSSFIVFIFMVIYSKSDEIDSWITQQELYSLNIAHSIKDEIDFIGNYIKLLSKTNEFLEVNYKDKIDPDLNGLPEDYEEDKRFILNELLDKSDYLSVLYILLPNGNFYLIEPYLTQINVNVSNLSHRDYFKFARETKEFIISDSFYGADGELGVSIFNPVLDNEDNIICFLGGFLHLKDLSNLLAKENIDGYDIGMVMDRNEQLIAHTKSDMIEKLKTKYNNIISNFDDEYLDKVHYNKIGNVNFKVSNILYEDPYMNKNMLGCIVYMDIGWKVILSVQMETINNKSLLESFVYAGAIAIFFIIAGLPGLIYMLSLQNKWMKAERKLKKYTTSLEITNEELESFSYSVSHDLRAPLRAIEGFGSAIMDDYYDILDDVGKDYLDRIKYNTVRMGQLIDDLLKLSRVTRTNIEKSDINISDISYGIIERLKKQKSTREVNFIIEPNLIVNGDYNLLNIVMENLIGNAWKFTMKKEHAVIEIGSYEMKKDKEIKTIIYIKDNGCGFDMKNSDKLFGAFQRLHKSEDYEGSGIGLATVKRIITRHNGRIWVDSKKDKGTTFYFEL